MALDTNDGIMLGVGSAVGILLGGYVAYKLGQTAANPALKQARIDLGKCKADAQELSETLGRSAMDARKCATALGEAQSQLAARGGKK